MIVMTTATGTRPKVSRSRSSSALNPAAVLPSALKPVQFCLSGQVAEPLARAGAAIIRVAAAPVEAALIELLAAP